ncbi:MAG: hypothetical protein HY904_20850 [Deltaproteobacteria bacterium]|nr:hypothetical protein [Deltaproteobacteria bacterium]
MTTNLAIHRRDRAGERVDRFVVNHPPDRTLLDVLRALAAAPVTSDGRTVAPVVFEDACAGPLCGSCALSVDGWPAMACRVRVGDLGSQAVLGPLPGFPVVADLLVDRGAVGRALVDARAWLELDGWAGPEASPWSAQAAQHAQSAHACTACGACQGACPAMGSRSPYRGPLVMAAWELLDSTPTGRLQTGVRRALAASDGGIADCGHARVCRDVCPQRLPMGELLGSLSAGVMRGRE